MKKEKIVLVVSGIVLLFCLIGLFVIYFVSEGSQNLFLVLPNELASPRININKIEEFCESDFLLTYENPVPDRVSLSQGDFPVTLIGTNSSYPFIMGFSMKEGSFFTQQAWSGKLRQAVLNEKAAIAIFGSTQIVNNRFRIRNDTWIVCGVIDDKNDGSSSIYIPSSLAGGEATALALNTSGKMDQAYVKNGLKTIGIHEQSFDFIDFGARTRLFLERALTIPQLFLIFLFLCLIKPLISVCKMIFAVLKKDLDEHYANQLLKKRRKTIVQFGFIVSGLIFFPVIIVILLIQLVSTWLPWQDIQSLAALAQDSFYPHLDRLVRLEMVSFVLFVLCAAVVGVFFINLNFIINKVLKNKKTFQM